MPTDEADLDIYSSIFRQHLQETQEHLQGATPSTGQTDIHVIGSVLWTSTEIDSFFHALSVHSRLRPDLISASIRTKNVLEVIEYLDLLEVGSKRIGRQFSGGSEIPIAYEMSKNWVSWEESQAQSLRARESGSISKTRKSGVLRTQTLQKDAIVNTISSLCRVSTNRERSDPRELSPLSRRRFQKRMCMRHKRAGKRGEEVDTTTSLLKPGCRSKSHKYLQPKKSNVRPSKPSPTQDHVNDPQGDCPILEARQPSSGIDAEDKVKLVHIPNLRNFLRFYVGLHDKKLLDGNEDISSDAIELLTNMTRDFVSDIVCRAVILQEEQKAIKGTIKVWHQRHHGVRMTLKWTELRSQSLPQDNTIIIKQSTINQCLDSMRLGARTRKQYFQDLLTSFDMRAGSDQDVPRRQADFIAPPHYEFLPCSFKECTQSVNLFSPIDEDVVCGDLTLDKDNLLDRRDSVADWAYEVDLWTKVNQSLECNPEMRV